MDLKNFIKDLLVKAKEYVNHLVNKLFAWLEIKVENYFETHPHEL